MFKISNIKITIFQKLLVGIIAMIILNVTVAYIAIDCTYKIDKNSTIILKAYQENKNLQDLKLSFTEFLMPANDYLIHGNKIEINNFKKLDSIAKKQLESCIAVGNNDFDKHFLEEVKNTLHEVESLSKIIFELKDPIGNTEGSTLMEVMDSNVATVGKKINSFLESSTLLIRKHLNLNEDIRSLATRNIIILVIIIITSLIVGGFNYVKEITNPLENLASTAKNVTLGNLDSKAKVFTRTHDELDDFASLFNNMIGVLSEKTVSRDYLNSIIQKIDESLIITNIKSEILIVNKATLDLLDYNDEELIGKSIEKILLGKNKSQRTTLEEETAQNIYNIYYSKFNVAIPVSFSKSFIYDNNNNKTGILYLAFNQTENLDKKYKSSKDTTKKKTKIKIKEEIPLTNRELEIIKLIIKDFSNQDIADKLFISIRTVETHRKHIMEKLHVKSVIGLLQYANLNNLI